MKKSINLKIVNSYNISIIKINTQIKNIYVYEIIIFNNQKKICLYKK